jgi:uncharacterized protein with GYD domain
MPRYLVQVGYTPEAWANLLKNPQNRVEAVTPLVRDLGGTVESAYLAFGEYDVVVTLNMPDNVSAAAVSMVFSAGGAARSIKTTPLMTIEEGVEAMRKGGAAAARYRPPSA